MAIERVAQASHVVERDHVIGLAEDAQHRAIDAGDELVERLGIARVDLPLALRGRAVPDERGGDRALRRQHERMAAGLADARDGDLRLIDLRQRGELGDRRVEILHRLGIAHVVADVAAMQRVLVGMLVEEIRRDADEAVAREPLRQVARVRHQAVALVHEHDRRQFSARGRHRQEGRQSASAADGLGDDLGHGSGDQRTMLGLRRFWSQSIRLTCRTAISQRPSRSTKRWPHQPER